MRMSTGIPLLLTILVLSLVMTPEMVSAQWVYEENPIADTYIETIKTNDNHGQYGIIHARDTRRALLQFDLSSIPQGAVITEARLSLNVISFSGGGKKNFTVHRVSKSWIEGDGTFGPGTTGATWINTDKSVPTPWSTPGGDFVSEGASNKQLTIGMGWKRFDVTDIVAAWITNGQPNYGFLIKLVNEASSASLSFQSNQVSENRPILQINWISVPVGGLSMPINKLEILTPYLALAGLITVISTVYVLNRRKD